jgi:long-chain acyl-CoA synthetase
MPEFARLLALARPAEVALRDRERALRWAEVDDILNRVANAVLAADLGPKRRVAVFAENAAETALAHLGGLLGGASTVPVNFHLTADEAAYILEDSETRIVFVGPETAERGVVAWRRIGRRGRTCCTPRAQRDGRRGPSYPRRCSPAVTPSPSTSKA